jgi:dTMP kinase
MKAGRLVTFEGIEGCGKTTQIRLLGEWLTQKAIPHVSTREPGGTPIGMQIRRILLSDQTAGLFPLAETLLYLADRFQHISEVIRPQLQAGTLVLCDRFHDSTVAYQGYGRGISLELLAQIWHSSEIALNPDRTFLLDIDPELGIRRSMQKLRTEHLDEARFEKEAILFHSRVREGFHEIARNDPKRIVLIDGNDSIEAVHRNVVKAFQRWWDEV